MSANIFGTLADLVNRATAKGRVLGPEQRVSAYDALRAATINSATVHGEEKTKGTLEVGRRGGGRPLASSGRGGGGGAGGAGGGGGGGRRGRRPTPPQWMQLSTPPKRQASPCAPPACAMLEMIVCRLLRTALHKASRAPMLALPRPRPTPPNRLGSSPT
jgi:hypothetical protein